MTSTNMKPSLENSLLVYYDLELCDGSITSEIYQIGAKTSKNEFSTFILPTGNIDWGVTKYAGGIKIKTSDDGQRQLIKASTALTSVNADNGIRTFIEWIEKCTAEDSSKNVFLIAHGSSDMPALFNNVSRSGLTKEFMGVVNYFADSLKYFQSQYPNWEKYSISSMYEKMFNRTNTDVHDALEDAKALYELMEESGKHNKEELICNIEKTSIEIEEAYLESARKVFKSIRKRKNKGHMSTNLKKFCAFPSEVLEKLKKEQSEKVKQHPVSLLLELCAKRQWKTPQFTSFSEPGPSKEKQYICKVIVNDIAYQSSKPTNKKNKAKSDAATIALKQLADNEGNQYEGLSEVLEELEKEQSERVKHDPVSALVELCAKRQWKTPQFTPFSNNIPSKGRQYLCKVVVNDKTYQSSKATNKKNKAKLDVASLALKQITESDEK